MEMYTWSAPVPHGATE